MTTWTEYNESAVAAARDAQFADRNEKARRRAYDSAIKAAQLASAIGDAVMSAHHMRKAAEIAK